MLKIFDCLTNLKRIDIKIAFMVSDIFGIWNIRVCSSNMTIYLQKRRWLWCSLIIRRQVLRCQKRAACKTRPIWMSIASR